LAPKQISTGYAGRPCDTKKSQDKLWAAGYQPDAGA
jgi:hypothetical protein